MERIDPPSGGAGEVAVTLVGTGFREDTKVDFGKDIEVKDVSLLARNRLVVTIVIAAKAAVGKRDVCLTNPADGQPLTLRERFEVIKPSTPK